MQTRDATGTYSRHAADIASILEWIADEVEVREDRFKREADNWDLAGDMAEIRKRLVQTLAFLSGIDERAIDRELEDLRS